MREKKEFKLCLVTKWNRNDRKSNIMTMALEGIKILDLSRFFPGMYCSMILADLGADVLGIEDRRFEVEGMGIPTIMRNNMPTIMRNKKHMSLNLKSEKGKEIYYRLVKDADVVLEGFKPGVAKRLGVDYDTLKKINPRIIYCAITGYGQEGPYKDMIGHDINYLSFGGVLGLTGKSNTPPVIPSVQIADMAAGGMLATIGIMAVLIAREKTGKGQFVDISMLDGITAMLPFLATLYWEGGELPKRGNTLLTGRYPCYNVYRTKDGKYVSIGALERKFWEILCVKLGLEGFIEHQYNDDERRKKEMYECFRETFKSRTREEWMDELKGLDVCFAKVLNIEEVFDDPHILSRKMVTKVSHPVKGQMKLLGIPIKLSLTPGKIRTPPASFGEHTEEVLGKLGYNSEEIKKVEEEGII